MSPSRIFSNCGFSPSNPDLYIQGRDDRLSNPLWLRPSGQWLNLVVVQEICHDHFELMGDKESARTETLLANLLLELKRCKLTTHVCRGRTPSERHWSSPFPISVLSSKRRYSFAIAAVPRTLP